MIIWKFLNKVMNMDIDEEAYNDNYELIAQSNIRFYKLYNYIMICLLLMLYVSTFFSDYAKELNVVYIVFFTLSVFDVVLLKKGITSSLKMIPITIYYGFAKSYIFCFFTSVIFNRQGYAITFFIFMILLPISFVIKPVIMAWIQTFVALIFCVMTYVCKPFDYAIGDILACIVFYVIAFVIAGQINKLRINNLRMVKNEQLRNATLEDQKNLLGVTLEIAKMCNVPEIDFRMNIEKIINILREQYLAKRAYVFEFDWNCHCMSNTFESVNENVTREKDNLQNISIDVISNWLDYVLNGKEVFIENIEDLKDDAACQREYQILKMQGIHTRIAIPIIRVGQVYGYIGIDDPMIHTNEHEFIMNVAQLLSQEFYACEQQNKLSEMSLKDALTGLNNRHSYDCNLEDLKKQSYTETGVVFADVNGLKFVNDTFGHVEGDRYIIDAANVLRGYFNEENIYRISGDEFVVICGWMNQQEFNQTVTKIRVDIDQKYNSILAIGAAYKNRGMILDLIGEAESDMYSDKKHYYDNNPDRERRKNRMTI